MLTIRADFCADLMAGPLWQEIQAHRFEVLPLDEDGLHQAILRPAEDVVVFVRQSCVSLIPSASRDRVAARSNLPHVHDFLTLNLPQGSDDLFLGHVPNLDHRIPFIRILGGRSAAAG